MSLTACLEEQIGRLVHPSADASPELAASHRFFFETRLAAGSVALGIVPLFLVAGNVPNLLDVAVITCLIVPLVAVALLSARGRLFEAELVSACGWAGLAATLVCGNIAGPAAAASVLILLPLEATFGESASKLISAGAAACGGAAVVGILCGHASSSADPWVVGLMLAYGSFVCARGHAQRRRIAQLGQAQSDKHREFFASVADLVIRFDGVAATVISGPGAAMALGIEDKEIAGRGFFDSIHIADRPAFLQMIGEVGQASVERRATLRLRMAQSGSLASNDEHAFKRVDIQLRRLASSTNDEARAPCTTVAQIRLASENMPHAAVPVLEDVAPAVETWRDRFLATISHELRTPLNAIIGFSEMLATEAQVPKQAEKRREYADIINASGQHLLAIVNSMLDLSKIDAGKFALAPEPFDVADLLGSCCGMMRLKAEQARVDLVWTVDPKRLQVTADKRACRQIVLNLLSNALKFTPEYGRATVEARLDGDWLTLVVADTGIGILAQDMARLGDPFFQAQSTNDRRFEGTGLGLSVVSGLVGLQGGTITAESAPGEGTRMTVRLPREGQDGVTPQGKARIETIARPARGAPVPETLPLKVKKIA